MDSMYVWKLLTPFAEMAVVLSLVFIALNTVGLIIKYVIKYSIKKMFHVKHKRED